MTARATPGETDALADASERARRGGPERHREKAREQGKLGVRERIALLLDDASFAEEGLLATGRRRVSAPTAWCAAWGRSTGARSR